MLTFTKFINESQKNTKNNVSLYLSKKFLDVLFKMEDCVIKQELINSIINNETGLCKGEYDISFIDTSDKNDYISYINSVKAKPILDKFEQIGRPGEGINWCWVNNRQQQKLSRFLNKLYSDKFQLKDIENFVDNYKTALAKAEFKNNFELVKGSDVRKYYHENEYNTETEGQLQRSCMKYRGSQIYFKLYEENPDKMNMLILKDGNGKIYGRANIWYLDQPQNAVFMDRIYTTYDWQIKLFIDYAIKHKWLYKSKQIYGGDVIPLIKGGKSEKITISVNIKPGYYDRYPYVDTLQFYNPKNGELTSDVTKFEDPDYYTLVLANGGYYQPDRNKEYKIDYLGRIVNYNFLIWSEIDKVFVHRNDAVYLRYENGYVTPEHDFIKIEDEIYLLEDVVKDPETNEYKPKINFNI